jgi:hypothetical protein
MSGADGYLRIRARDLIEAGSLPRRLPDRKWGGPGTGAPCMVCGVPVKEDEIGLEIELPECRADSSTHHFHVRCFSVLELELYRRELARRAISGTDQVQAAAVRCAGVPPTGARP